MGAEQKGRCPGVWGSHLGHVLGDDVKAALLLHDHPQELHQVAVSELPARRRRVQGFGGEDWGGSHGPHRASGTTRLRSDGRRCPPHPVTSLPSNTHVITDASARKACAVASFLMHFTATLFPR